MDAAVPLPRVSTLVCQGVPRSYGACSDECRPSDDSTGYALNVAGHLVPEQRGHLQKPATENQPRGQLLSAGWVTENKR